MKRYVIFREGDERHFETDSWIMREIYETYLQFINLYNLFRNREKIRCVWVIELEVD